MGGLSQLTEIDIAHTTISGPLLPALASLPAITRFRADGNTSLTLCPCDDARTCACRPALPALETLSLKHCRLGVAVGRLLAQYLSRCPRLEELMLSNNALHGALPDGDQPTISFGTTLKHLDLSGNRIEGELTPGFLSKFPDLGALNLSNNSRLTGPLPREGLPFDTLGLLDIEGTDIKGPVPTSWQRLRHLSTLRLGPLPIPVETMPGTEHDFFNKDALKAAMPRTCYIHWGDGQSGW